MGKAKELPGQDALFGNDAPREETPPSSEEALARLRAMDAPGDEPFVRRTSDFPEERTEGEGYNVRTPAEDKEFERLTTQGVSIEQAFFEATGRDYIPPPPDKPLYGRNPYPNGHPAKPSQRTRTIGDANSGDPHLR